MAAPSLHSPPTALVLFAHPRPHLSRVTRKLAEAARALPRVTVHELYQAYPDFYVDVAAEQARLAAADIVVFLHPILWYSMPSLLKEWVDSVLLPGWAYGAGGHALQGKTYWLVASTADPAEADHTDDYLPAFRLSAQRCGMRWEAPLVLHGDHLVDAGTVEAHLDAFIARLGALLGPAA